MFSKIVKLIFSCSLLIIIGIGTKDVLAFALGETINFTVDSSYDYANRSEVKATLRQVGDKALYYVEDEWWQGLRSPEEKTRLILDLLAEFDEVIYPRLTGVFGSEWSPGIDHEYRLTILITQMKEGVGGYFNAADEFPKSQAPSSNEREMIYLNANYLNSPRLKGFLAHEFQHLTTFYQKEKLHGLGEEIWLNEARSEYTATLCGYDDVYRGSNLEKRVSEFLRNPSDSLTEWTNQVEDYGPATLFMQYLVSRYGQIILTKMMKVQTVGIASINQALADLGFIERFAEIFTNWTVANYVNDCQLGEGQKFCYLSPHLSYEALHVNPSMSNILPAAEDSVFSFSDYVKDWSGRWYEILPAGAGLNLALTFRGGNVTNFQVPMIVFGADGNKTIRFLKFSARQESSEIILNFGEQVRGVVLIPSNQTKTSGFSANEPTYPLAYTAKMTLATQVFPSSLPTVSPTPSPIPTPTARPTPTPASQSTVNPQYPDGSLIRAKNDFRVYVIRGKYKRWLQSSEILAAYPHLSWQSIIEVTPVERDWYRDAWLIRADGDYRVYEINADFSKHWLNMSAQQFSLSGRLWEMVFVVNETERELYRTGAEVLR